MPQHLPIKADLRERCPIFLDLPLDIAVCKRAELRLQRVGQAADGSWMAWCVRRSGCVPFRPRRRAPQLQRQAANRHVEHRHPEALGTSSACVYLGTNTSVSGTPLPLRCHTTTQGRRAPVHARHASHAALGTLGLRPPAMYPDTRNSAILASCAVTVTEARRNRPSGGAGAGGGRRDGAVVGSSEPSRALPVTDQSRRRSSSTASTCRRCGGASARVTHARTAAWPHTHTLTQNLACTHTRLRHTHTHTHTLSHTHASHTHTHTHTCMRHGTTTASSSHTHTQGTHLQRLSCDGHTRAHDTHTHYDGVHTHTRDAPHTRLADTHGPRATRGCRASAHPGWVAGGGHPPSRAGRRGGILLG